MLPAARWGRGGAASVSLLWFVGVLGYVEEDEEVMLMMDESAAPAAPESDGGDGCGVGRSIIGYGNAMQQKQVDRPHAASIDRRVAAGLIIESSTLLCAPWDVDAQSASREIAATARTRVRAAAVPPTLGLLFSADTSSLDRSISTRASLRKARERACEAGSVLTAPRCARRDWDAK